MASALTDSNVEAHNFRLDFARETLASFKAHSFLGGSKKLGKKLAMNAETLYTNFVRSLNDDVFPTISTAGFFGMGGNDLPRVQPVLGVWIGLNRYGLLEKDTFKQAIREDKIGDFFEQGRLKLAACGHGYALKVQEMNVFFDGLPPLGPEPPRDLVNDTWVAFLAAMDTYAMPHFQTAATKLAAWDKAENLLSELMQQPELPGAPKRLKQVLEMYQEARDIYKMRRVTPAGLKALVQRLRASGAVQASDSSDDSSH